MKRLPLVLAGAAMLWMSGCASSTASGRPALHEELTRRGVERSYTSSPNFGGPRGSGFEDLIPVGGRITAVHVAHTDTIDAIWLSYERNGVVRDTPRRGGRGPKAEVLKLKRREKIVGIHAYGKGTVDELVIETNQRTVSFGDGVAPGLDSEVPWYTTLSEEDRRRYVGIGITGRADEKLRQLSLRIQIRDE